MQPKWGTLGAPIKTKKLKGVVNSFKWEAIYIRQ
jgi:hypothetical protein